MPVICKIFVDIQNSRKIDLEINSSVILGTIELVAPGHGLLKVPYPNTPLPTPPPPPPPKRKPGLPDDFCRPSVREYNLRVVPALNLKRTPVGAIFVDPFRGVRGISQQKMKELLSLMIKWEQKALLVFLIWSKFPSVWVIKVPCGDTYNFLTLSGVSFQ